MRLQGVSLAAELMTDADGDLDYVGLFDARGRRRLVGHETADRLEELERPSRE